MLGVDEDIAGCSHIRADGGQAAVEGRVLVTANMRDFEPLLRERADESYSHAGVILVPSSVRNEAFGVLISGVEKTLADIGQEEWVDRVQWIQRP